MRLVIRGGRGTASAAMAVAAAVVLAACGSASGASSGTAGHAPAVATRSVPSIGTVLTAGNGFTLYHLTKETNGHIKCTGSCRSTWPPLLTSSGSAPSAPAGITGSFGTLKRPDGGAQVTFNGMPLYRYSGDTAPGQANGQGIGGVWFAVTTAAGAASPSSSSGGGYGGGGYGGGSYGSGG
jgi:predicted lipoprotein with Yx(FWY)xxD motif